jgi:hypothetical protein
VRRASAFAIAGARHDRRDRQGPVKNILAKRAASDRTHAVTIGVKRGIIEL